MTSRRFIALVLSLLLISLTVIGAAAENADRVLTINLATATDEELAESLEMSVKELVALEGQISVATVIPLDDYLRADAPLTSEPGPSDRMEKEELRETLAAAIERLPEKEKKVVALYYYEELTLKEISLLLDLSEARISQLHTKAIFRMRGYLARMKASLV